LQDFRQLADLADQGKQQIARGVVRLPAARLGKGAQLGLQRREVKRWGGHHGRGSQKNLFYRAGG